MPSSDEPWVIKSISSSSPSISPINGLKSNSYGSESTEKVTSSANGGSLKGKISIVTLIYLLTFFFNYLSQNRKNIGNLFNFLKF